MLNSNLGGGIPGYMGESGVKATSPTDPHLSDPHAAANEGKDPGRGEVCDGGRVEGEMREVSRRREG